MACVRAACGVEWVARSLAREIKWRVWRQTKYSLVIPRPQLWLQLKPGLREVKNQGCADEARRARTAGCNTSNTAINSNTNPVTRLINFMWTCPRRGRQCPAHAAGIHGCLGTCRSVVIVGGLPARPGTARSAVTHQGAWGSGSPLPHLILALVARRRRIEPFKSLLPVALRCRIGRSCRG